MKFLQSLNQKGREIFVNEYEAQKYLREERKKGNYTLEFDDFEFDQSFYNDSLVNPFNLSIECPVTKVIYKVSPVIVDPEESSYSFAVDFQRPPVFQWATSGLTFQTPIKAMEFCDQYNMELIQRKLYQVNELYHRIHKDKKVREEAEKQREWEWEQELERANRES